MCCCERLENLIRWNEDYSPRPNSSSTNLYKLQIKYHKINEDIPIKISEDGLHPDVQLLGTPCLTFNFCPFCGNKIVTEKNYVQDI